VLTQTGLVKYFTKDGKFYSPAERAAAARATQEEQNRAQADRDTYAAFQQSIIEEMRNLVAALNRNAQPVAQAVGANDNTNSSDDLLNSPHSSDLE
jgi:hypothetical protein